MGRKGLEVCTDSIDHLASSTDADLSDKVDRADRVSGADRGEKEEYFDFVGGARLSDCRILTFGLDSPFCADSANCVTNVDCVCLEDDFEWTDRVKLLANVNG